MASESIMGAFAGGILSFLSPCFLPLVPAMLAYITVGGSKGKARTQSALLFVFGFALMFSIFGIALAAFLSAIGAAARDILSRLGGLAILAFGLCLLGYLKLDLPMGEHGLPKLGKKWGMAAPFFMGCAFSLTLSPCASFILGGIMVLASVSAAGAFPLFLAYSAGLALPLLAYALLLEKIRPHAKSLNSLSKYANLAAGILLSLFGLLALAGALPAIA